MLMEAVAEPKTAAKGLAGKGLARFFELRGREIVEAAGALWYSVPGRIFMSLPHQLTPDPERAEIRRMLRQTRGLGVRYPSQTRPGYPSGLYVCRNKEYDFGSVQPRLRSKVRRGLENCEIRRIEADELLAQGLLLNHETMSRQGRYDAEFGEAAQWRRLVYAIPQCPEIEPMGAFIGGRLAAYCICCREDGWLHMLHQMSRQQDLEFFPNHALDFAVTRQIVLDPTLEAVCFGLMGLVAGTGLHDYKVRLGYETIPQNSVFELHPALAPVMAGAPVVGGLQLLRKLRPQNQLIERVTTVLAGARISRTGKMNTTKEGL